MKIAPEVKISDNGFVFNSKTGDSFSLNPIAFEMIRMIEAGNDFDQIQKSILTKYDVAELAFERDFYEFMAMLKHHQIIIWETDLEFD